jgi:hypothetical protein
MSGRLASIAREPLLHVLVLGAALFAILPRPGGEAPPARPRIVVRASDVARVLASWTGAGAPTKEELAALVDAAIEEEVLLREAASLARGDEVVRERLRKKVEALAEDAGGRARVVRSLRERYQVEIEWPAWAPSGDPAAGTR